MNAATAPSISPETLIPDLFRKYPQARAVLDRHGLEGCGGRLGPVESLGFFANAHGVDQNRLLAEIQESLDAPVPTETSTAPAIGDTLYRRYFLGAIVLILSAGATWGAWLLWQIGFTGKFTGVSIHHVNAHGHAQIYGWVGLFIMGFAYQAFPRIWHTKIAAPRLAVVAFVLMAIGIIVRTIGMTISGLDSAALYLAMIGGAMEILSAVIFVAQMLITFRRGDAKMQPYVAFVFGALFFFLAQGGLDLFHTFKTMTAATREQLVWYVSTYQAPLRDLQIHGLALFMIFGVSLRMLPALLNVPQVSRRRAWSAFWILTIAVAAESILFVAYRFLHNHSIAALLMVPWIMLAIGSWQVAAPWRLWKAPPVRDRSAKFIRIAYAWLALSLLMLLLLPVYQVISPGASGFSHAYYGAIRHAITVGFISMMIMGMAAKVVPTLNGIDPRTLPALWGPFILINIGCFLRVSLQTATDWHAGFFPLVGISGTLEVIALTWWGIGLAKIMRAGKRLERAAASDDSPATAPPVKIDGQTLVTEILRHYPQTQHVFDAYGFTLLRNPLARRTMAKGISLEQAARFRGVNLQDLLMSLQQASEQGKLPVVSLAHPIQISHHGLKHSIARAAADA